MNQEDYQKALELTTQFQENTIGYSDYNATTSSDKQYIRQHNTIICQLEIISSKLNYIINKLENPLIPPLAPPLPIKEVNDIIDRLATVDISKKFAKRERQYKDKKPVFGIAK